MAFAGTAEVGQPLPTDAGHPAYVSGDAKSPASSSTTEPFDCDVQARPTRVRRDSQPFGGCQWRHWAQMSILKRACRHSPRPKSFMSRCTALAIDMPNCSSRCERSRLGDRRRAALLGGWSRLTPRRSIGHTAKPTVLIITRQSEGGLGNQVSARTRPDGRQCVRTSPGIQWPCGRPSALALPPPIARRACEFTGAYP